MKQSRFSDSQIMAILKQAENGMTVSDVCREHGIRVPTFYKWRAKFGGMDAYLIARMKELEPSNQAQEALGAGDTGTIVCTAKNQSRVVDGFHARSTGRWPEYSLVQRDR